MNEASTAALASWRFDPAGLFVLVLIAAVYVRGWLRGRRLLRDDRDFASLASFLGGLALLLIATESPLDAFDNLFLAAHMTQHLILMMIAPGLILLGKPTLPLLRGLPKQFVKEGLGPFLTWPALRRFFRWLTSPVVALLLYAISTVVWHVPLFYELALSSPAWHGLQHASFFWTGILFWWPVIRPGPGKYGWPLWVGIPYLLLGDLLNTALSALFIFSGKLLYPSYAVVQVAGISPAEDQTLAGAIMWVPGSVIYLVPAVVIATRMLETSRRPRPKPVRGPARVLSKTSWIKLAARYRSVAQILMLMLAVAVVLDGFFGMQVAPLNLAGVLPWIYWRAFALLAIVLAGNLFCFACPFIFVRDIARRVFPARYRWPRMLRTKWLAAGLFVGYLWTYEAFSLWNSPWLTAWVVVGYFSAAVLVDGLFRGASFCKYVCPIGQFHFVASLVSPREIAVRKTAVCHSCRTYDCIRGNERERGCETYLFQPRKVGNLDCTFCLDCVKACPHDNVGLMQIGPAMTAAVDPYRSSVGRLSKRWDWAALAFVIVFAAFVNAAGMVNPVMMWEHQWHARLGSMPLVVGVFTVTGVVVLPALAILICGWKNATRFAAALVPIGVAMWAAHLLFHLFTRIAGAAASLIPLQIVLLDAGLLLTLYVCWRVGKGFKVAAPWFGLSCALYAAGIWIIFQPMQMRGMMH